jgi:ABC-type lipoprotein release transport system permease subunit
MANSTPTAPHPRGQEGFVPTITLAVQRIHQTWWMLLITGLGMVCAVMLVSAVPMYSKVAMTAGLRSVFSTFAQNGEIVVRSQPRLISSEVINQTTRRLNADFQQALGPYLVPPQFSLETQPFAVLKKSTNGSFQPTSTKPLAFIGTQVAQASSHLQILQGRLPRDITGNALEIAVKPDTAAQLGVGIGSVLYVGVSLFDGATKHVSGAVTIHVVGIFTQPDTNDPFWHGQDFAISSDSYSVMASNTALLALMNQISRDAAAHNELFSGAPNALWYYRPDTSRISIDDLDALAKGTQTVEITTSKDPAFEQIPYLEFTQAYVPYDVLSQFRNDVSLAQIPVGGFVVLVLGLIFFFVSIMADLLVDRQSDAIAILRSRGASRRQIFGALLIQALGLGVIALIFGPMLAFLVIDWLARQILAPADQGALSILTNHPIQSMLGTGQLALLAVVVAVLAMLLALWSASSRDALAIRREAGRSTYIPLWQRLNLDAIALVVALSSFGVAFYLSNAGILNTQQYLLLLPPLMLLQAVCFILAGLFLFLRFLQRLLRLGTHITQRSRGAASLLALAHMSRSPRQTIRAALLLALTSAVAIFSFIFTATQSQRVLDVANYRAGADFSGAIPTAVYTPEQLESETAVYRHISGVISATLGFTAPASTGGSVLNIPINFKAVDADTFAQTAIWTQQDSSQSLASLMQQLTLRRTIAITQQVVPAIIDSNTANTLHLASGAPFTLNFEQPGTTSVRFVVIAVVEHIPTPGDSSISGVLTDYRTFATVYTHNFTTASELAVPLNYVWLRTKDDAASVANVRKAVNTLPTIQEIQQGALSDQADLRLDPLYDRRAMLTTLEHQPLYLTLVGALALGAGTALLLALLGALITALLNARSRLTNFAVLRALGATPRQLASVLTWEYGIVYAVVALLGIVCGTLLSSLVLPTLTFTTILPSQVAGRITGIIPSSELYAAQNVPPIQVIIPSSLAIVLGILIVICIIATGTTTRIISIPSTSQVLRLNED